MRVLVSEKLSQHKYKTPEGYLICTDAILARTGKQQYLHDEVFHDGSNETIDLDRPYDEVFNEKTLASFENKPITVEHPQEDVNVGNYKDYSVGYVRDVRQGKVDGTDVIIGNLVITDQEAIDEVESGNMTDLSCGYDCDVVGSGNDYKQANIRGNHVALCKEGRAGCARIIDSMKDANVYPKLQVGKFAMLHGIGKPGESVIYYINKVGTERNGKTDIFGTFYGKINSLHSKSEVLAKWPLTAKSSSRGFTVLNSDVEEIFDNMDDIKSYVETNLRDSLENDILHVIDNHARCISVNSMKEFNEVKRIADSKGVKIMYNDDTGKATFIYDNVLHDAYEALWYTDKRMKGDYQTKEFASKQQMLNFYNQHKNDSDKFGWWLTRRDSDWNVVEDIDVDDANPESFGTVEEYKKSHKLDWQEITLYSKKQNKCISNVDAMQKFSKSDVIGISWNKYTGNVILHIDDSIHDDFGTVEQYMKSHNLDWQELSIWYNNREYMLVDKMKQLSNKHVYRAERDRWEGNTILFVEDSIKDSKYYIGLSKWDYTKSDAEADARKYGLKLQIEGKSKDPNVEYDAYLVGPRTNIMKMLKATGNEDFASDIEDMSWQRKAQAIPQHNEYHNDWSASELKRRIEKADDENKLDILKGLLSTLENDVEADIMNKQLNKTDTISHYSKYIAALKSANVKSKQLINNTISAIKQLGIHCSNDSMSISDALNIVDMIKKLPVKDASVQEMVKYLNKSREGDTKYWIDTDGRVHWKELASIGSEGVFKNTSELKEAYEIEKEENGD